MNLFSKLFLSFCVCSILLLQPNFTFAAELESENTGELFAIDYSDPGFKGNQGEISAAANREFNRADAKLNEVYNNILAKYENKPLFLDKLTQAELAWLDFRDAQLAALYPNEPKYYGSSFSMYYNIEKAKLTWARVIQLNEWLKDYPEGTMGLGSRTHA